MRPRGPAGQRLVVRLSAACCGGMERLAKREQAGLYDDVGVGIGVAGAAVGRGAGPEGLCPLLCAGPQ
jgi:hypothetical protein